MLDKTKKQEYFVCKANLTRRREKMGYRVKEIREKLKMTQEELERKSGVSRQTISAIENNRAEDVKVGTLCALAKAMGTTIDSLFFEKDV